MPDAQTSERSAHHLVAAVGLEALLRTRELQLASLAWVSTERLEELGVQVVDLELLDAEVRFGPQLVFWTTESHVWPALLLTISSPP